MKRMISKNIILGASLAALIFTSCSKTYLDVNNDPNRPTDDNTTPQLIFTQAEQAVGSREASGDWGFLDNWMGYFAPNGDFAPSQIEQTYNIDFGFSDAIWQNHYNVLFDLYQVKTKAMASGDSVLAAASTILSAKLWQELVDLFGDIPYTQAFHYKEFPTPAYDAQKDVYNSVLLSLDTAVDYMKNLTAAKSFAPADIINNGDQGRWAEFGNTIKLRMLIRQSQVSGFDPSAEIAKIQSSGGVSDDYDVSENPGYINDVNKQSPFYANFGYDASNNIANTSINANAYILNILTNSGDPRLERFFSPSASGYNGNVYGDPTGTLTNGAGTSYFGPGLIGDGAPSSVGATQDQWIYPKYETLFLEAEAIARGWLSGDVKATYENAVKASFEFLKVDDADNAAATYLAEGGSWDDNAGASVSLQVQFITYQKYIANTGIDPLESYSDQRRLHFLTDNSYISSNPAKVANTLPLRLLYPQSEYTTNSSSVQAEGTIDAYTTKLFWEP
ncbi:MAG: SusD/RagB family nutrient-binding outer membrane lipoprotein [Parafilimonas sp.]